jgi:hypothetical protein
LFQLCFHITQGHIPPQIACVLRVACLSAMTKLLGEIRPIVMGEALYQLTSCALSFQLCEVFITHFPHTNLELQLKVVVK